LCYVWNNAKDVKFLPSGGRGGGKNVTGSSGWDRKSSARCLKKSCSLEGGRGWTFW